MKHITFFALLFISSLASAQIISQYVETDSGSTPKGLEIWNNTASPIDFSVDNLFIEKGTNGATPSLDFTIDNGVLAPNEVLIVGTIDMETAAITNSVLFYEYNFTFNGDDALVLKLGTTITDVFGDPGNDPGQSWEANGVDTRNQNIALLSGITTGELVGFTDPSTRFETINSTPSDIANGGLDGFGIAPAEAAFNLLITEIFSGQAGADLTVDWFEIKNLGTTAWTSGVDLDLFYDDDSADATTADLIQGISDIQPNESVIVLITGNTSDIINFQNIWGEVLDFSNAKVGYTDGAGLGGGGDEINLWLGDPLASTPFENASYPDTTANDGQTYDVDLGEFSVVGNANGAVATLALGGSANDVPNIGSPGDVPAVTFNLSITEIFAGQSGTDLTEDWFEIKNNGNGPWVSSVHGDLFYDDDSADATTADLVQGIADIQAGESVVVLVTGDPADITTFEVVWGEVLDLENVKIGYTDGAGLGGGGDAVNLWLGDPLASSPFETASYPDTSANDGQSYDIDLGAFSVVGNANGAVATLALGGSANDVPNIGSPGDAAPFAAELIITEIFSGQVGTDLTQDWFEIKNIGPAAWVSGINEDLFYDDESADATTADLIQGISDIQPGESVVILVTGDTADTTVFETLWGEVLNLTDVKIGYTDGAGLGGGGDAVNLWLGDPLASSPFETASYPDTSANDGQSYDVDLGEFSVVGNANGAVATLALGGNANDVPNIGSPGDAFPIAANLVITEIFSGQAGADLTEDWFEITNNGGTAWVSGVDADLYYDDDSADATTADLIQGITDIQPGESVVVLVTGDTADITTFENVWGAVLDLSDVEIGYTDGAGLGGGGDAVNLWLGDPLASTPFETASYPSTGANDGQSYDVDLGEFSVVGNANGAAATLALGGDNADVPNIGSPGNAPQTNQVQLAFTETLISVDENGGSVTIEVSPSIAPSNSPSIDVSIMMGGTAVEGTHFTFSTTTLNFPSGSTDAQTLNIPILDNTTDDSSVFFVLELTNPVDANLGNALLPVYILDDDNNVPAGDDSVLDMNYLTSYTVDPSGTAEILKFDAASQRLFVVNDTKIEILDFSNPLATTSIGSIDVTPFGGGAQSVDVNNGLVAIAVSANIYTDLGSVVFTDIDGNNPVQVTVGALPDMLTFTPDGNKVLVANEGEPSQDYTIDPEGSVSVIDVTGDLAGITQADVTAVNFNAFDSQLATLLANDVRIFGPGASVSQDLEPEFITVSEDSQTAYVACQENNAYAIIDLTTNTVTDIRSFGLKDHSLPENTLDSSDETDFIFDASWPIKGMYMPDGITNYTLGGVNYLVTANEGDAREYSAFEEERSVTDADYNLDPAVFSNIDLLELDSNLGAINVTNASGDANGDGLFEEIHVFGGRSFSIFNADTGALVYDSGNDFAHITAADPVYGPIFNASNSNNSFKNRSENKGVEPENVIVQEINGNFYAFVILERIGGVMAYDVSNPSAPVFLEYENSRDATPGGNESGDLGPEGIVYISPEDSGTGKALIVLSNEVSATLSIFELTNITLSTQGFDLNDNSFKVFPNPVSTTLKINQVGNYEIYNLNGQKVIEVEDASEINVQTLSRGIYIIKNNKGNVLKFIKQ